VHHTGADRREDAQGEVAKEVFQEEDHDDRDTYIDEGGLGAMEALLRAEQKLDVLQQGPGRDADCGPLGHLRHLIEYQLEQGDDHDDGEKREYGREGIEYKIQHRE